MNSHELLREEIKNKAVVHGKVILSSGKEADYYVDLRRVTLDHVAAPLVGAAGAVGSTWMVAPATFAAEGALQPLALAASTLARTRVP